MKKTRIIAVCAVCVLLIAGVLGFLGWKNHQDTTYITINGVRYLREETVIDLTNTQDPDIDTLCGMTALTQLDLTGTGITAAQYETLHAALPACRIIWDVPFQGSFVSCQTELLTVSNVSQEDMDLLTYFSQLTQIDASQCKDLETISQLQNRFPELNIVYTVELGGVAYSADTVSLTLQDADAAKLTAALPYLPHVTSVAFTGTLPESSQLAQLAEAFPNITFSWVYSLYGQSLLWDVTEIDLSDIPMDGTETVESALGYFPKLERVIMSNCGIPSEEMDALNRRHEDVRFIWTVQLGKCTLRTDATVFMPYQLGYYWDAISDAELTELKYCTDLICIDFGHMDVTDLSFLYSMPNVQYLLLCDNPITDITPIGTLKELKFLELFLTGVQDISPIANCHKLEDLNLSWTYVTNLDVIKDLPNLQRLWLNGARYYTDQLWTLQEAMPNTIFSTVENGSSTGYGWRESPNYYAQRDLFGEDYDVG